MPAADALYHTDLEIRILARQDEGYPVEITFSGEREFPPGRLDPGLVPWVAGVSPEADGERLFAELFGDSRLSAAWAEARGQSPQRRVRLRIDRQAPELHAVPWELLRETPPDGPPIYLAATPETPFSRYLACAWRPGRPVLERPVRMVVAIAGPDGLAARGLAPIDAAAERRALEAALGDAELEVTFLEPPVTLEALEEALRQGPHLLHLFAHGGFNPAERSCALYLADGNNAVALIRDRELAEMLGRQGEALRLVFLASCGSAERSPADALRGLAPQLVAAGVPAVVAMQDAVTIDAARAFSGTFYRRLLAHGRVDLAANEARSTIVTGELAGAAVPVLFQRLKSSLLFARRGQILGRRARGFWVTLLENIADGECTPLLGPDVTRGLLPGPAEIARILARKYNYPFPDRDRLPRVAQFVGTLDQTSLRRNLLRAATAGFRARHGLSVASTGLDETGGGDKTLLLDSALRAADWSQRVREAVEIEIHHQLADLGLPLYLTTNFDSFMTLALEARGRRPRREALSWRTPPERDLSQPTFGFEPPPSPDAPVVLHLFGHDGDPRSMVLSEDDHLDYLSRLSRDHEYLLPLDVSAALARTTLLFLGYDLRDLDLKIILRGLLAHLDAGQWGRLHVAVQIDTESSGEDSSEDVKHYLEDYFGQARINVYWGSCQQFVAELHARWRDFTGARE